MSREIKQSKIEIDGKTVIVNKIDGAIVPNVTTNNPTSESESQTTSVGGSPTPTPIVTPTVAQSTTTNNNGITKTTIKDGLVPNITSQSELPEVTDNTVPSLPSAPNTTTAASIPTTNEEIEKKRLQSKFGIYDLNKIKDGIVPLVTANQVNPPNIIPQIFPPDVNQFTAFTSALAATPDPLSIFVPYTGALKDVDLGPQSLSSDVCITAGCLSDGTVTLTAGVFDVFPQTPNAAPFALYDIANKKYVDDSVALENLWDRVGSTLSPHNANDNIDIGSGDYTTTGDVTAGKLDIDNITIDAATILSDTGAISFGNENLTTTGTLGAGAITGTSLSDGTVTLTGGVFDVFPQTPSAAPSALYDVANKKYVDDAASGGGTFLALTDTISGYTNTRILFESGAAVVDSANLTFDGTTFSVTGDMTVIGSGSGFKIEEESFSILKSPVLTAQADLYGATYVAPVIIRNGIAVLPSSGNTTTTIAFRSDDYYSTNAVIRFNAIADSLSFTSASGGYAFDNDITTTGTGTFEEIIDNGLAIDSAVYTDSSSQLTTTAPASGTIGYWDRSVGGVLTPSEAADDDITTTGNVTANSIALGTGTALTAGTTSADTLLDFSCNNGSGADAFRIQFREAGTDAAPVAGGYIAYDSSLDQLSFGGIDGSGVDFTAFTIARNTGVLTLPNTLTQLFSGSNIDSRMSVGPTGAYGHSLYYLGTGSGDANYLEIRSGGGSSSEFKQFRFHVENKVIDILNDNHKLTWGASGATDSYIQFNATDLEIFSSGAVDFLASDITTLGDGTFGDLAINDGSDEVASINAVGLMHTDVGLDFDKVTDPASLSLALIADGGVGNLGIGIYTYHVTFVTSVGETHRQSVPVLGATVTTDATHKQVTVTIPTSTDYRVTGRNIYRTTVGNAYYRDQFLTLINDNTTTAFVDNIADGSLGSTLGAGYYRANTTNDMILVDNSSTMVIDSALTAIGVGVGIGIGAASVFIGANAGHDITSGKQNTAVGGSSGANLTTGGDNCFFGISSGGGISTGSANISIGRNTLAGSNSAGSSNTVIGYYAGRYAYYYNTFIGASAGLGSSGFTPASNVAIGYFAGTAIQGDRNIFLGNYAGSKQTTNDDLLIIDNQSGRADIATEAANAIIYGVMAATAAAQTINFNVGTADFGAGDLTTTGGRFDMATDSSAFNDYTNALKIGTSDPFYIHKQSGTNAWIQVPASGLRFNNGGNISIGASIVSTTRLRSAYSGRTSGSANSAWFSVDTSGAAAKGTIRGMQNTADAKGTGGIITELTAANNQVTIAGSGETILLARGTTGRITAQNAVTSVVTLGRAFEATIDAEDAAWGTTYNYYGIAPVVDTGSIATFAHAWYEDATVAGVNWGVVIDSDTIGLTLGADQDVTILWDGSATNFGASDITTSGSLNSTSAVAGQSVIASGLVVNNDGNGTAADDFRAATLSNDNAFVVDASADEVITNVDTKINTLTASKPVFSDANKVLVSQDITQGDIVVTRKTANSMTVTTGTLSSGTVTDTQTWGDGNSVNISEVAGVPGYDVLFTFASVTDFTRIGISAYYTGALAAHYCEIQVYDDTNTTWRTLWTLSGDQAFNYRFSDLPVSAATRVADYINGSDEVKIRFYHPTSGNASHDLYIDYVSITD